MVVTISEKVDAWKYILFNATPVTQNVQNLLASSQFDPRRRGAARRAGGTGEGDLLQASGRRAPAAGLLVCAPHATAANGGPARESVGQRDRLSTTLPSGPI